MGETGRPGLDDGALDGVGPDVLAELVERIPDGVVVLDDDLRVVYSNAAAERCLGFERGELTGKSALIAVPEEIRAVTDEVVRRMPAGGGRGSGSIRRADGGTCDIEYSYASLELDGRRVVTGVFRELSGSDWPHRREKAFARIAASVAFADSLATTLDGLALSVAEATGMTACAVVVSDGTSRPHVAGTSGLPADYADRFDAALDSGVWLPASEAIASSRTVVVERASEDPALVSSTTFDRDLAWATLVCLPMRARGRPVGALKCFYGPGQLPSPDGMVFLAAVADQAAVAVENARLFAESRERLALEARHRLARELHDSVSQAVFSMTLEARAAQLALEQQQLDPTGPVGVRLTRLRELAQGALAEMRALIFELRPGALNEEGLVAALRKHAGGVSARSGVIVDVDAPVDVSLPAEVEEQLYRVGQEALSNVVKHAEATHAVVRVGYADAPSGALLLEVSDDGTGFEPRESRPGHLGLTTMRQRVERLGGTFDVLSRPGAGSTIRAVVPVTGCPPPGRSSSGGSDIRGGSGSP